jgi:hypothetical protein
MKDSFRLRRYIGSDRDQGNAFAESKDGQCLLQQAPGLKMVLYTNADIMQYVRGHKLLDPPLTLKMPSLRAP